MPTYSDYRSTKHFSSLDGIRCLAIVGVIWHHSIETKPNWFPAASNGFLGVDLFFVLSGFLIVTLLLRERERTGTVDLVAFWGRRVLRIFPLYYAVVLGLTGLALVRPGSAGPDFLWTLPFYLTYTVNWVPHEGILAVAWSLCAEEQFYAFWPPIERFFPRSYWPFLVVALFVNVAMGMGALDGWLIRTLGDYAPDLEIVHATFTPILLGVALAHGLHQRSTYRRLQRALGFRSASLTCLTAIVLIASVPGDLSGLRRGAIHLVMTAFVASVVLRPDHLLCRVLEWGPIRRIGTVSYGMYLLHVFVQHLATKITQRLDEPSGLHFLLMLFGTWVVAEISFRTYEGWFLQFKSRFRGGELTTVVEQRG